MVAALLADLEKQADEHPIDLFVFSGDLAFDGSAVALQRGKDLLLDPLRTAYPDVPLVLTPGNHDVDRNRIDEVTDSGLRTKLTSHEAVQERLKDPAKAAQARESLAAWDELADGWDAGLPEQRIGPYGRAYRLEQNGISIAVGSFDSAWRSSDSDQDRGHLIVGADYIRDFLRQSVDADINVITFHHPLDWLAAFDAAAVRAAVEESHALVLTGHDHIANPILELTARGSALYCHAPCSYSGREYGNGYGVIDIDLGRGETTVGLRRWAPGRERFVADVETVEDGARVFAWPVPESQTPTVYHASDPTVLKPLAILAKEQSMVVNGGGESDAEMVSDFMVPPRFWPVPHTEVFDRAVDPENRPEEADPLKEMARNRVVIVSGPKHSGVSTALLWLLELHYRQVGSHMPAYVTTDPRFSLGRIHAAIGEARARAGENRSTHPVIVAIDDVEPADSKALGRMIRLLHEDEDALVLLGCHGDVHETVSRALEQYELHPGRLYLGPFGRPETRQLATRIAGPEEQETVQKVLHIVQRQGLPRNPLNLAALIWVITREPTLTAVNESGLLQSYVHMLLDNPSIQDPEGLNMDYRRREHLLQEIARHVVKTDRQRVLRGDVEKLVLDYYERIGWRAASAGRLIDSLIERRVLVGDAEGVGFRYPALLHLFAAKASFDDPAFEEMIFAEPITYGPIIRHVAGLRRNDQVTLERVLEKARAVREEVTAAVEVGQFKLIEDKHGWSTIHDLNDARKLVQQRPEPPTEEELDEIDNEGIVPDEPMDLRPFREQSFARAVDELVAASSLAASVLQSSELVEDVDLRAAVMREVIAGWTVMTVLFAMEEDMTSGLHELLEPLFEEIGDDEERSSRVEHVARLFVISLMSLSLYIETGSIHHEVVLSRLLGDQEFMAETANALFASMLYSMLHFPGWQNRLAELYKSHGSHPMVSEVVRRWTLEEYYAEELPAQELAEVEDLLVEILTPDVTVEMGERASYRSKVREDLRSQRTRNRWARDELHRDDECPPAQGAD